MGGHGAVVGFDPAQVAGLAGTEATAMNTMSAEAAAHHFGKAGFINGQLAEIGIVPRGDALGVEVNDRHLDLGAAIGDFLWWAPHAGGGGWHLPSGLVPLSPSAHGAGGNSRAAAVKAPGLQLAWAASHAARSARSLK
jgi:hypothetical protein